MKIGGKLREWDRMVAAVAVCALAIVVGSAVLALTPSSYGQFLAQIRAQDTGLIAGQPRAIRSDEWALWTPFVQAAVRNDFQRFNHTSFYNEDLRGILPLPLRDWGMAFKPLFWGFFLLPPANAYGLYCGGIAAAFLAGYFLLFRALGFASEYALPATLLLFACGFTQFWWTSWGPCIGLFPWVALTLLWRCAWYVRVPLFAWALACWGIALGYPAAVLSCALALAVWLAARRGDALWPAGRLAAIAGGGVLGGAVLYGYFAEALWALGNSVYPGHRLTPPGTVPAAVLVSQFWPALTFTTGDFHELTGRNLCEIGAVGSFLPLLTLCGLSLGRLRKAAVDPAFRAARRSLAVVGAALAVTTWWMAGPCPKWIGRLLYWDHFDANRLLFLAGLLLMAAVLMVWEQGLVTITPRRAAAFVLVGPIAGAAAKVWWFPGAARQMGLDWGCVALAGAALVLVWRHPRRAVPVMLWTVVAMNAALFLRFNPLQSAYPIFETPDTPAMDELAAAQAGTPGSYVAVDGFFGATLNGLGFRSVAHVQLSPKPEFFRPYFPGMPREAFDFVFNRFAHIRVKDVPMPYSPAYDVVVVPVEVFRPIRNRRRAAIEAGDGGCSGTEAGGYGLVSAARGSGLEITGWAPWMGEAQSQVLRIRTRRPVVLESLVTVRRTEVAERLGDYRFEKAGFRLELSARDRRPLSLSELRISADNTVDGETVLDGCAAR